MYECMYVCMYVCMHVPKICLGDVCPWTGTVSVTYAQRFLRCQGRHALPPCLAWGAGRVSVRVV